MEPLTTLALRRIPLEQVWEEGVLNAPLPQSQIRELVSRITLENLYREGLLDEKTDPDLIAIALQKGDPHLLWPYIGLSVGAEINYPVNPFSQEAEKYIERDEGINPENFDKIRQDAILLFIDDLIQFLDSPGFPYTYEDKTFVWGTVKAPDRRKELWKIITIRNSQSEDDETSTPLEVEYFDTLDEMLTYLFIEIETYTTLIEGATHQGVNTLQMTYRYALQGLQTGLRIELGSENSNTETLWELLEQGVITLNSDFELSLNDLKDETRLTVVDNFLYIIVVKEGQQDYVGDYFVYYGRDDGLLILTSLYLKGNNWNYEAGLRYSLEQEFLKPQVSSIGNVN